MTRRDRAATVKIYVPDRPDLELETALEISDDDVEPLALGDLIAAAEELAVERGYLGVRLRDAADGEIELAAHAWEHPRPHDPETFELVLSRREIGWLLDALRATPGAAYIARAEAQISEIVAEIDTEARTGD